MDNTEARIADGKLAEELRQNPILERAFAKVEERCSAEWRKSSIDDATKREAAFYTLRALDGLRTEIEAVINDAKMAKAVARRK